MREEGGVSLLPKTLHSMLGVNSIIVSAGRNDDRGAGVGVGNARGIAVVVVVEGRGLGVRAEVKVQHYRRHHAVLITIIIGVHQCLVNFGVVIIIGMEVGGAGGIITGDGMVAVMVGVVVQAIMVRVTINGVMALPHGSETIIILEEAEEEEDIIKEAVRVKE